MYEQLYISGCGKWLTPKAERALAYVQYNITALCLRRIFKTHRAVQNIKCCLNRNKVINYFVALSIIVNSKKNGENLILVLLLSKGRSDKKTIAIIS